VATILDAAGRVPSAIFAGPIRRSVDSDRRRSALVRAIGLQVQVNCAKPV
jgi:hypothetical protein